MSANRVGDARGESGIDVDAVMAQVRERVRRKRELGIYSDQVDAMLRTRVTGLTSAPAADLAEASDLLERQVAADDAYDPRSRRPLVGPLITVARRGAMGLLRWWINEIVVRQDRLNRLLIRELAELRERAPADLEARLAALETQLGRARLDELAARRQGAPGAADDVAVSGILEEAFAGRGRVLVIGIDRAMLELLPAGRVGLYAVDTDADAVNEAVRHGLEARAVEWRDHLGALRDGEIDGLFSASIVEEIPPAALLALLQEARRTLRADSPLVLVARNVRSLAVGAHSFWAHPARRRPVPSELLEHYARAAGFVDVFIRTLSPTPTRLAEQVPDPALGENMRLLNETIFGDRVYVLIARAPS